MEFWARYMPGQILCKNSSFKTEEEALRRNLRDQSRKKRWVSSRYHQRLVLCHSQTTDIAREKTLPGCRRALEGRELVEHNRGNECELARVVEYTPCSEDEQQCLTLNEMNSHMFTKMVVPLGII
jgi:hypothetical protein